MPYIILILFLLVQFRKPLERLAIDIHNAPIIDGLNPVFKPLVESFISRANDKGFFVWLTDGARSVNWQPIGRLDFHHFGVAIDCNLIKEDISLSDLNKMIWYKKADTVAKWIGTGVPQIAINEFQLRWGGYFSQKDTVHFDMGNIYGIDQLIQLSKDFPHTEINKLDLSHA